MPPRALLPPARSLLRSLVSTPFGALQYIRTLSTTSSVAKRLSGKTILITGASSGIGRATALEFARTSPDNLKLILTARRLDVLETLAKDIKDEVGNGVDVLSVKLDVSEPEDIKSFVGGLAERDGGIWGSVDVLVNNAYVSQAMGQEEYTCTNDHTAV
jgi:3-hydroxy acid dehydrogenase/malonic semialdehyde reductase